MDDKLFQSVVELTEQRNKTSLGYCVIATLAEMMPLKSAKMMHFSGATGFLIAEITTSDDANEGMQWQYGDESITFPQHDHQETAVVITKIADDDYQCLYPISIDDNTSAQLSFCIAKSPHEYEMLVDGLVKIYRNYLTLLFESERDKLTGLLNRRAMEDRLKLLFHSQSANENQIEWVPWIGIIDIDKFKGINDRFGHLIGDEVLLLFAQQMQSYFTSHDQIFRFGGEEFVVILPESTAEEARQKIEGFRRHVESYRFPQVEQITFSAGLCAIRSHDYVTTILDHADKALYYAKDNGRNQLQCYDALMAKGVFDQDEPGDSSVELF